MNSHLVDDESIEQILINVEKHPNVSLDKLNYKFNFNCLTMHDTSSVDLGEIVGIDGSGKTNHR